jgi:hypothetical protein
MRYYKLIASIIIFCVTLIPFGAPGQKHEITFCGEKIPVENDFVAKKLMSIIRQQIPYVNLSQLRKRADKFFPVVEYYLRETGLPLDLKYIAVVESGFLNATSKVGAQGVWQLMPATATDYNLRVNSQVDERNDFYKATWVACQVLADYYLRIKKQFKIPSWTLTAAAYNFGIGNMSSSIRRQGKDYFSMHLNQETALYVYKLIAVKELFEYPELYIKDFGYNVFNRGATDKINEVNRSVDSTKFGAMEVTVNQNDGKHGTVKTMPGKYVPPNEAKIAESEKMARAQDNLSARFVSALIKGKYKKFRDGDAVTIELQNDLRVRNSFMRQGVTLTGTGWIINGRIFIDLGFNHHDVILYDSNAKNGIAMGSLKNDEMILLKIQTNP